MSDSSPERPTRFTELEATLSRLVALDDRYGGWKPAPAPEEQIREFEEQHSIRLADSHRSWLLHFGQSPLCPVLIGSHVLGLGRSTRHIIYEDFAGPLSNEFSYSGTEPISLPWDEAADEPVDPTPLQGTMCLGHAGCDEIWVVVVTGPESGNVWGFVPSLEEELQPTGMTVPQWHLRRVEHAIEALARARRLLV